MVKVCAGVPPAGTYSHQCRRIRCTISPRISTSSRGRIHASAVGCSFQTIQWARKENVSFKNLPEARRGQWGEGLAAAEMEISR